jgi:hypothetical protein
MGKARDLARLSPNSSGQLPTANIQDDAINAAKIAADSVGSSEIASGAVGYSEIANDNQSFKYRGDFPTGSNQDYNSAITSGIYDGVAGSYTGISNSPPGYSYGNLLVINTGNFITQIWTPNGSTYAAAWRGKYVAGGWQAWRTFG